MLARGTIALVVLGAGLAQAPVRAQDSQGAVIAQPGATPAEAERARQRELRAQERIRAALEKKAVVYGGYATDLSRTEKGSRPFSLRKPRDPRTDYKNIWFEEKPGRADRARGFVLFSVGF